MKMMLFVALLVLNQSSQVTNHLIINGNGETLAEVDRSEFMFPIQVYPLFNKNKLTELEDKLDRQISRNPVNASINDQWKIIPEQPGVMLNRRSFTEQFYNYFYSNGQASIEIPTKTVYPRVDSELISEIRTDMIGYYATYYNRRNKERSNNIELASSAINNHVVFPGEIFSFNQVVGNRTKAKGYLPAPVIVKGELSEGIGGGICQVSSTLYNAAYGSGLKIEQRYSHSKRVPYVPPGRDATVSWYGPDFTFRNKYNQPILIRAHARNGVMITMIFSSDAINYTPREVPRMSGELPKEAPAPL